MSSFSPVIAMKKLLALALVSFLGACSSTGEPDPMKLDYSSLGKVYLDTQDVRIVDASKAAPEWAPYVGHLFKPTLTDAVGQLAADRLQAVGRLGRATLTIKDATVTEQPLEMSSDTFDALFTRQQASKYIGRAEVTLEAQASNGAMAMASAYASYSATLPEDPDAYEKYDAYSRMLTGLMKELNRNLEAAIQEHMTSFVLDKP